MIDAITCLMFFRLNWAIDHPCLSLTGILAVLMVFGASAWASR